MRRLESIPRRSLAFFSVVLFFLHLVPLPFARADSPPAINIPVALAPVQRDTPVELVALTVDADISEDGSHTLIDGNATFKVHNTDRLNDVQVSVGFPAWAGDPYSFNPSLLDSFAVTVEGKKTTLTPSRAELRVGSTIRAVDWYTFTLALAGDEKKTVRMDFSQNLGEGMLPRFAYGLVTATGWKGSIGSARLTINFRENTTLDQLVAYDPANATLIGDSVTWLFLTHEPPANPTLTFIRPSLWDELVNRRRAVQQNANDANARGIAGNDRVRVYNDRGSCTLVARIDDSVAPGVVCARAVRWNKRAPDARNVNALTSDRLTDAGGGPTFYSCLVEVETCGD